MELLSLDQFRVGTGSTEQRAELFYEPVLETIDRFKIGDSSNAVAAFLATIGVESTYLEATEESLYYRDAARLASIYPRKFRNALEAIPYTRNHKGLSNLLYNGYHGRGLIQLTWEQNYRIHGKRLGFDYLNEPDLLKRPWHAAMSAGSFWDLNGCNDVADDIEAVTERVNGPRKMHLKERTALFNSNVELFA